MREPVPINENSQDRTTLQHNKMELETISGYMDKWTNYVNGFQRRWFVLKNGILSYYFNKYQVDVACKGSFNVSSLRLVIISATNFKLITKSGPTLYLRCENGKDATNWMLALNNDIHLNRKATTESSNSNKKKTHFEITHSDDLSHNEQPSFNDSDTMSFNVEIQPEAFVEGTTTSTKTSSTLLYKQSIFNSENELNSRINKKCDIILSLEGLLQKYKTDLLNLTTETDTKAQCGVSVKSSDSQPTISNISMKYNSKDTLDMLERTVENISKEISELIPLVDNYRSHTLKLLKDLSWKNESLQNNLKKLALQHNSLEQRIEHYCDQDRIDSTLNQPSTKESRESTFESNSSEIMSDEFQDALSETVETSSKEQVLLEHHPIYTQYDDKSCSSEAQISYVQPPTPPTTRQLGDSLCLRLSSSTNELGLLQVNDQMVQRNHGARNHRSVSNFTALKTLRSSIPPRPAIKLHLWSIIKNAIGKDLTKIPMPVNFNEPLSLLQRVTEPLQHSALLDEAASTLNDAHIQLVYIAAFNVSCYSSNAYRTSKPFNPLLNETYELDRTSDLGWRSLCEQVTHHPPACTLFAEGNGWIYTENFNAKSKFRGKYLSVEMLGQTHLHLLKSKHDITWNKVTCTVNNIIIGTLSIDQTGTSEIINHTTGDVCKLIFHSHSMFNKSMRRKVTGTVTDTNGVVRYILEGKWDEGLKFAKVLSENSDGTYVTGKVLPLWSIEQLPPDADKMYNFSEFTCSLNQTDSTVAPTDSRCRQDQRLMEEGNFQSANQVKCALEQKQRLRRTEAINLLKSAGGELPDHCDEAIDPVWFNVGNTSLATAPATLYKYKGGYWEHKLIQDWSLCPDIFTINNDDDDDTPHK